MLFAPRSSSRTLPLVPARGLSGLQHGRHGETKEVIEAPLGGLALGHKLSLDGGGGRPQHAGNSNTRSVIFLSLLRHHRLLADSLLLVPQHLRLSRHGAIHAGERQQLD